MKRIFLRLYQEDSMMMATMTKRRTSSSESESNHKGNGIQNIRAKPPHIYDHITRKLLNFGKLIMDANLVWISMSDTYHSSFNLSNRTCTSDNNLHWFGRQICSSRVRSKCEHYYGHHFTSKQPRYRIC